VQEPKTADRPSLEDQLAGQAHQSLGLGRGWDLQGLPGEIVRQKGKGKGSRDLLSIPRAASRKDQKLVNLAKDRKATRNPCRGWGRSCLWPAHHSRTYTQEIKGTIFRNTLIITKFNILLSVQEKSSGQKTSKKIDDLNSIINSVDPMN